MKKTYLLIGTLFLIVITILYLLFLSSKNGKEPKPASVIQFQPSPSATHSTIPSTTPSAENQAKLQMEADQKLTAQREALLKKYPWYLKLPFKETNYFVYFDTISETFVAKLYPQKTSSTSVDEQTASLKSAVIEKIKALGSNADQYRIDWRIIPE